MKKRKVLRRKGMTVAELVVAILLLSFAVIVMGRLTMTRIAENESLNYQYTMQAAEGMLYNMYKDFHSCRDVVVDSSPYTATVKDKLTRSGVTYVKGDTLPAVITSISFDLGASGSHVYSFDDFLYTFYYNGASQFKCEDFEVNGDMQHLYVSIRLANGERIEYTIYR